MLGRCTVAIQPGPRGRGVPARQCLYALIALFAASVAHPAWANGPGSPAYDPERVLVKFAPRISRAEGERIAAALGMQPLRFHPSIGVHVLRVRPGMAVTGAVATLAQRSDVAYAEPDYLVHASLTPNDPLFGSLWGLHNTGQNGGTADADMDAPEAWDLRTSASDVVVAVIDTGVDYPHTELQANLWHNPGEVSGNGLDDDGNGFVDDTIGWDFRNDDNNPMDDNEHGTHVSGTIGAVGDNGVGVAGVCWSVQIMALKFLNALGSGSNSDAIACIEYATTMGADVMSNS